MSKLRKQVEEQSGIIEGLVIKVNELTDYVKYLEYTRNDNSVEAVIETRLKNSLQSSAQVSTNPGYYTLSHDTHNSSVWSAFLPNVYSVLSATYGNNITKRVDKNVSIAEFYGQPVRLVETTYDNERETIDFEVMFGHDTVTIRYFITSGIVVSLTDNNDMQIKTISQSSNNPLQLFIF